MATKAGTAEGGSYHSGHSPPDDHKRGWGLKNSLLLLLRGANLRSASAVDTFEGMSKWTQDAQFSAVE